jgi:hypothetical protein
MQRCKAAHPQRRRSPEKAFMPPLMADIAWIWPADDDESRRRGWLVAGPLRDVCDELPAAIRAGTGGHD